MTDLSDAYTAMPKPEGLPTSSIPTSRPKSGARWQITIAPRAQESE